MPPIEFIVALLVVTIPLVAIARRIDIPYPVVLIVGGLVLGFVPGLPRIELNPDLVLVIFLPPLMYWESVTAPTDEMRANAAWIWPMALGLVIATIIGVAVTGHAIVPGMGWAVAFTLGAIVAPTDEIAVAPTLEQFSVPRRIIAIIEGESLLNDAGSLVIYAAAISAAVTDVFSWPRAVLHFLLAGLGAIGIGLIAGWLAVEAWRRIEDPQLEMVISVVLPFVAYVPAQRLELSGVLAVVAAGVYVNRFTPTVITPAARLQATGFWETIVFLANVVIFTLVGLQLHVILAALSRYSVMTLVSYALIINAVVIAIRFAWVFGQGYPFLFKCGGRSRIASDWKHLVIMAWSGPRGGVSLAAALAIPMALASGQPFPDRDLLIFLTFSVILVTLVGAALTLPAVLAWLKVEDDDVSETEERKALGAMAAAAIARVDELERRGQLVPQIAGVLRRRYQRRKAHVARNRGDVAARVFQNRQRTSTRSGILKAEAVRLFAKALGRCRINAFSDMEHLDKVEQTEQQVRQIPGQGSGQSFEYFRMLAGSEELVKADRMIGRFVATALGVSDVLPQQAAYLVKEACRNSKLLSRRRDLTPRLLDYAMWSHARTEGLGGHRNVPKTRGEVHVGYRIERATADRGPDARPQDDPKALMENLELALRAYIEAKLSALTPEWWTERVPSKIRHQAEEPAA